MTTTTTKMLPYNRGADIDWGSLEYDPDELKTRDMLQDSVLQEIGHILSSRFTGFSGRSASLFSAGTIICYNPNDLNVRVQPDYYVAFGVDEDSIRRRRLYLPWEVGKPPDFALEVASPETYRNDLYRKPGIYAQIGIPEYWRFDSTGGRLYGQPLAGDRLEDGVYQPISLTTEPDGVLKGYSEALKLSLCWFEQDNRLVFYDPATGNYLRNLPQEQAALEAERRAREADQAALESERRAREADQARIRQLEEQLRRLQSGD
jgi:Uma2 family endonuclease